MKQLDLLITARSPLAIGRQKPGGSVSEVERYIPGTVLRGAIAAQLLALAGEAAPEPGDDFEQLFTSAHPAIFHNAYPAVAQLNSDTYQAVEQPVWVVPATAMSAKTNPGFCSVGGGVFDTLIDRFWASQVDHAYVPILPTGEANEQDQADAFSGFYSIDAHNLQTHYAHSSTSRFLTRVGINRRRAVAEDQILYSLEVLNESFLANRQTTPPEWPPMTFCGSITVPNDALADLLAAFINGHAQAFRLGGSASRGLGKASLKATASSPPVDLAARLTAFNQTFAERRQLWQILRDDGDLSEFENHTFFSLDLQADAILSEDWRRTTVISPAMLQQIPGAPQTSPLRLHAAYSSYDYRSGWNSAWGLMKDQALVTRKGSVYLYSTPEPQAWLPALEQLELYGIGDRTCEGFGRVRICHEFHQVLRENPA